MTSTQHKKPPAQKRQFVTEGQLWEELESKKKPIHQDAFRLLMIRLTSKASFDDKDPVTRLHCRLIALGDVASETMLEAYVAYVGRMVAHPRIVATLEAKLASRNVQAAAPKAKSKAKAKPVVNAPTVKRQKRTSIKLDDEGVRKMLMRQCVKTAKKVSAPDAIAA